MCVLQVCYHADSFKSFENIPDTKKNMNHNDFKPLASPTSGIFQLSFELEASVGQIQSTNRI